MIDRVITQLSANWKFSINFRENTTECANETFSKSYNDSKWRTVSVPHDWAVEGPFSPDNDPQYVKVHADGILERTSHIGRTGGLLITGVGVYRNKFFIKLTSKNVFLEFDGVMSNSEVYVNGVKVGGRPYGYSSFSVDITKVVVPGSENVVVVFVNPKDTASRWYPGAGIYRPVRLIELQETFVNFDGTYIVSKLHDNTANITIKTEFSGEIDNCNIIEEIYAPNGVKVAEKNSQIADTLTTNLIIDNPWLWDCISPNLYKCFTKIVKNDVVIDTYETKFGIRQVEITREKGFVLNGKSMKLKGVCLHHDLGMIGSAVNSYAIARQLNILKDVGCNAIRCTHNPFSREFMNLCDEMGFLVIAEAYDEWKIPKVENGYATLFEEWGERDLVDLIRRDRNHPSVIMWSLGNEILDQDEPDGKLTARFLRDISHREDPTRPTTFGINNPQKAIELGFCDEVDIVGFNYQAQNYGKYIKEHPNWIILGSETASTVSSRGVYHHPAVSEFPVKPHKSGYVSAYDLSGPPWSYVPEKEFTAQEQYSSDLLGEFVWTGFDYLGEPTPFRNQWPSHVSYFGMVDMAGIPKDRYYNYKARWTDKPMVHLFPHWNWDEGSKIPVHAYSNCEKIELFINNISQGFATTDKSIVITEDSGKCDEVARYRFMWDSINFEAGELKAIGYNSLNEVVATDIINTASSPKNIALIPEKTTIVKDELCFIRVTILDKEGNICPTANNKIEFSVEGAGVYIASDNGDQCSTRIFSEEFCRAFNGHCVFCLKAYKLGVIKIKATAKNLIESEVFICVE